MTITGNHFQANFGRFLELDESERKFLKNLETKQHNVANNTIFWRVRDPLDKLYIIQDGWACTYRDNLDGMRQIVDVLLPGDIIGLRDFTLPTHTADAMMITSGSVSSFSYKALAEFPQHSARLSIALFSAIARQEALLMERMMLNLHRGARSRIGHFILETYTRLNKLCVAELDCFHFPISQQMLGEILGLTNVHVNRVLMGLENAKILKKHRCFIEVFDKAALYELAGFNDDYLSDELDGLREYLKVPQVSFG